MTHDQDEAFTLADRVAVLSAGRIVQVDTPERIWRRPASLELARFLGHDNLVEVRAKGEVIATPWGAIHGYLPEGTHLVSVPVTAVRVGPDGEITAEVVDSRFADGRHRLALRALNQPLTAEVVGARPAPGSSVQVSIDAEQIIPIPRTDADRPG